MISNAYIILVLHSTIMGRNTDKLYVCHDCSEGTRRHANQVRSLIASGRVRMHMVQRMAQSESILMELTSRDYLSATALFHSSRSSTQSVQEMG